MRSTTAIVVSSLAALGGCTDSYRVAPSQDRAAAAELAPPALAGPLDDPATTPPVAIRRAANGGAFPARIAYRDRTLVLQGAALCEWGIFGIDLYEAALYAERPVDRGESGLDADQVLVIHLDFARTLTAAQLTEAYTASTRINAGDDFAQYEDGLAELVATMEDTGEGESYTFVCDPDEGILVQRNDDLRTTVADDAYRALFVRMYLGDKPPTKALRDGLLGRE